MIQKTGDYYVYEDDKQQANSQIHQKLNHSTSEQNHHAVGNIKQRIKAIRLRFQSIKQTRKQILIKQKSKQALSVFQKIKKQQNQNPQQFNVQIFIPEEVLKLEQRISAVQQKLSPNQLFRRKIQQKGPLVERIKILHQKLEKILLKSSQIIIGNIQGYCASLDDKQEYLKIVYLKDALSKTKGLKQQILVIQEYLKNLHQIQMKIKSFEPIQKLVVSHSQIIQMHTNLNTKINEFFTKMKNIYEAILQQIEQISQ